MATDKTPDETAPIPATKDGQDAAETVVLDQTSAADDTTVLPATASDATAALPVTETTETVETTVLPVTVPDETAVLPATETTALPVDESAASDTEGTDAPTPAAPTSPIGALYSPAQRVAPDPMPTPTPTDTFFATYAEPDRADPVVEPAEPVAPARRRLRVGTVVWGLVIAAIGVGLLAWAAGVAIDLQLAMIVLLAVAGTALLVGSIVSGARNARR